MGHKEMKKDSPDSSSKHSSPPKYSSGYIVGLWVLALGTLGFVAGFASPYWHFSRRLQDGGTLVHGLWMTCVQESATLSHCQDSIVRAEDLLRVVQFLLESAAVLLLLMACLVAVAINFNYSYAWRRTLDLFTAFGSVLAVLGTLAYLFHVLSSPSEDPEFQTFTWGYGINATGSLICVLAAVLIATSPYQGRRGKAAESRPPVNQGKEFSSTQREEFFRIQGKQCSYKIQGC